jgi:uncharacterized protein YndB with AHSA1/START domain
MEVPVPYGFTLTTTLPASPQEIYDAWLDSVGHSEMTGGDARMSDETGADVSAWDGYITGRNVELVPGERIVQSWRTTNFTDEHEDSLITVTLEKVEGGTLLTLWHTNVPDAQTSYEQGGWQQHYFDPMKEYFSTRQRTRPGRKSKPAARKTKPKRAGAARSAKSRRTAQAAPSRRAAPKAKTKVGKKAPKRAAAAKARRTAAKKTSTKTNSARGKRR